MPNIRAELICTDGSVINVNNIILVKDERHVYIERLKSYRDIISLDVSNENYDKGAPTYEEDELSMIRAELCPKIINQIIIHGVTVNPETEELTEAVMARYTCVGNKYAISDVYRTISIRDDRICNILHYVFCLNISTKFYTPVI